MQPFFSVAVDVPRDLVHVTLAGLFTPADVDRVHQARDRAHSLLTCPANQHVTLIDIRDVNIQPQQSVDAFLVLLSDTQYHGRRIAFVTAASLARTQAKRAAAKRGAGYFETVDQAEEWLLIKGPSVPQ